MRSQNRWWLLPIAALVIAIGATGWWGYGQNSNRQALAAQVNVQYAHSFHSLQAHMQDLHGEIQKAQVSGEQTGFDTHLRNAWRLSDLSSADVERLPLNLMPMHHTQAFLAQVGKDTNQWLESGVSPGNPTVTSRLQWMEGQTWAIIAQLDRVQAKTWSTRGGWAATVTDVSNNRADNQIIDGFHKMDAKINAYPETKQVPKSIVTYRNAAINNQPAVSAAVAKDVVARALTGVDAAALTAKKISAYGQSVYEIGSRRDKSLYAEVSVHGGHLISIHRDNTGTGPDRVDVGAAGEIATRWLTRQGFPDTSESRSHIYDHAAYFVWAPVIHGATLLDHDITVAVSLQNGRIVQYNAKTAVLDPVTHLGARRYSTSQLQRHLNPDFQVREAKASIIKEPAGAFIPATSFYGLYHGRAYRIDMNAQNGHEMDMESLVSM